MFIIKHTAWFLGERLNGRKYCISILLTLWAATSIAAGSHEHHHSSSHSDTSLSATGSVASASEVNRTIHVSALDEMRFVFDEPPHINSDEVIEFVITNKGRIKHEFSIGTPAEQIKHQAMMREMPDMIHEDGNSVTLQPGETKSLIWRFKGDSNVLFACNLPGHAEAGMTQSAQVQNTHQGGKHH